MSEWDLTPEYQAATFDKLIRPALFGRDGVNAGDPTAVFLGGQPGAGASRAVAGVRPDDAAVLSSRLLSAFHPRFLDLSRSRSPLAVGILERAGRAWLRDCLVHAREGRSAFVLDEPFASADAVLSAARGFERAGFRSHVAIVATPRTESLLALASGHLLALRNRDASAPTSVEEHDAGMAATAALVSSLEASPEIDRLTIFGRDGAVLLDADRATGFASAREVLARAWTAPLSELTARLWLEELTSATDYAEYASVDDDVVRDLLAELHEVALREVVPALGAPADSVAVPRLEARLAARLEELRPAAQRRAGAVEQQAPAPAPTPAQPDRGISR